jgi:hypothetical protein
MIPEQEAKRFFDNKDFQARFFLEPEVDQKGEADFSHFDKNLALTNLVRTRDRKIDEPTEAREILKCLHVLNNPKYFYKVKVNKIIGYKNIPLDNGNTMRSPVIQEVIELVPKFPKTFHKFKSGFFSFINTAASTNGFRVLQAISNRTVKEETLNEQNNKKGTWFGQPKRGQYY